MIVSNKFKVGWISGMPRSGTTWLSQIFASSPDVRLKFCPLFSYEFKNALNETSTADEWENLFCEVYKTNSDFLDQEYLRKKGLVPTFIDKNRDPKHLFIKSTRFHNLIPHILELNQNIQFIHLVRNPCATLYSWLSNPNEFPENADFIKEWRLGTCRKSGVGEFWGFDDWKEVNGQALRLSEQYPKRFKILRYEDLTKDTKYFTQNIFEFCDIEYGEQTKEFLELSSSRHDKNKRSVFKQPNLKDDWQKNLPPSVISAVYNELKNTKLEQFLLP